MTRYCCPSCQARSRFNVIKQVVTPVKIDPRTGEMIAVEQLEPYHLPYNGPEVRVQCASCGLIDDEIRFTRMAEHFQGFGADSRLAGGPPV